MLYSVVASQIPDYMHMSLPLPEDMKVGDVIKIFGIEFTVRQAGTIVTLTNKECAMTLQQNKPIPEPAPTVINQSKFLRINQEVDLFFDTKEIRLNADRGYLTKEHGLTYDALYRFLMKEWRTIASAFPEHSALPMEHEPDTNNYCLINGWNWFADYNLLLKDGCWSRKDVTGRHV